MPDKNKVTKNYTKAIEATTYYEIGKLVADSRHSLKAMLSLPFKITAIAKRQRQLIASKKITTKTDLQSNNSTSKLNLNALALMTLNECKQDSESIIEHCKKKFPNPKECHQIMIEVARISAYSDTTLAINIIQQVPASEENPQLLKKLAFLLYDAGELNAPASLLEREEVNDCLIGDERIKSSRILAENKIFREGYSIPKRPVNTHRPKTKVAYVCHTSFPHHTNGYAVRTHNVALHLKKQGLDIHCISRPGYPWDRKDALDLHDIKNAIDIDGLEYFHYKTANSGKQPFNDFVESATDTLYEHIKRNQISHILAASNYLNALPAIMAARRAGIPFIYDVRGLWEYSTASKVAGWEETERFNYSRKLETLISSEADTVITISTALKEKLIARGVEKEKIQVALNATEKTDHLNSKENLRENLGISNKAIVFGFIGTMEKLEGLDNLLFATKSLIEKGHDVFILLVGDGHHTNHLKDLSHDLNMTENVRFIGRVSHKQAKNYYAAIDICVYPRLAESVCQLVPPLKPLEALSHNKRIVVPALKPIIELVGEAKNVFIVEPNDAETLTCILEKIIDSSSENQIAEEGFDFVLTQRSWENTVKTYIKAID